MRTSLHIPKRLLYQGLIPFITMLNDWAMLKMDSQGIPRYYKNHEGDRVCAPEPKPVTRKATVADR